MADTLGGFNSQTLNFNTKFVNVAIYRHALQLLRTEAVYCIPESVVPLPRQNANNLTVRATIWSDVPPSLTALSEGIPPLATKMAGDYLEATLIEVGAYTPIYSQANYQLDELVLAATDKMGRAQFLVFDTLAKNTYAAATTDLYGGTASNQNTTVNGSVLTTAIIDEIVARLRENDVKPFADGMYRFIAHPRMLKPLLEEASNSGLGFLNAANMGTVGDLKMGVLGAYHGIVFVSAGSRGIVTNDIGQRTLPAVSAITQAAPGVATSTAHGLVAGSKVQLHTLVGSAPLASDTTYYVVNPTTNTFQLALTPGGTGITTTSAFTSVAASYQVNSVYKGVAVGQQAIAMTDLGSLESLVQAGGGPTDPIRQVIALIGYKGFVAAKLVKVANFSDGSGNLSAQIQRSVTVETSAA